jgi:hypothetical protein
MPGYGELFISIWEKRLVELDAAVGGNHCVGRGMGVVVVWLEWIVWFLDPCVLLFYVFVVVSFWICLQISNKSLLI